MNRGLLLSSSLLFFLGIFLRLHSLYALSPKSYMGTSDYVRSIHDSDIYAYFVEVGAGVPIAAALFSESGASRTVYHMESPYAQESADVRFHNKDIKRAVSRENVERYIGVIDGEIKEGRHRKARRPINTVYASSFQLPDEKNKNTVPHGWIGLKMDHQTFYYHITFPNYFQEESPVPENEVRNLYIRMIGEIGIELLHNRNKKMPRNSFIDIVTDGKGKTDLLRTLEALAHNEEEKFVFIDSDGEAKRLEETLRGERGSTQDKPLVLFKGSFRPAHLGHKNLMDLAKKASEAGSVPVFMISMDTFQKGQADPKEIAERIRWITRMGYKVIVCKQGLFKDNYDYLKQRLKSDVTFVAGVDTVNRIVGAYQKDFSASWKERLEADFQGARFLYFGRPGEPLTPDASKTSGLFVEMQGELMDISSTQIRNLIAQGQLAEIESLVAPEVYQGLLADQERQAHWKNHGVSEDGTLFLQMDLEETLVRFSRQLSDVIYEKIDADKREAFQSSFAAVLKDMDIRNPESVRRLMKNFAGILKREYIREWVQSWELNPEAIDTLKTLKTVSRAEKIKVKLVSRAFKEEWTEFYNRSDGLLEQLLDLGIEFDDEPLFNEMIFDAKGVLTGEFKSELISDKTHVIPHSDILVCDNGDAKSFGGRLFVNVQDKTHRSEAYVEEILKKRASSLVATEEAELADLADGSRVGIFQGEALNTPETSDIVQRLLPRWNALMADFGVLPEKGASWFSKVCAHYAEPKRAYHTLEHIEAMLNILDRFLETEKDPELREALDIPLVTVSVWLHDVVYQIPRSPEKSNEALSANFAREILMDLGMPEITIQKTEALIRISEKHEPPPGDRNAELLSDLDLSILGEKESVFELSERQLRAENRHVSIAQFTHKRIEYLKSNFLTKERLFHLDYFDGQYEVRAKSNLKRVLGRAENLKTVYPQLILPKTTSSQIDFDPYEFLARRTAVYPGFFDHFGAAEEDILNQSLTTFDRVAIFVMRKNRETSKAHQVRVNRLYRQLKERNLLEKVSLVGIPDRSLIPKLVRCMDTSLLIRKRQMIPDEDELAVESQRARENYSHFGLETVFFFSSPEHLDVEKATLEKYKKILIDQVLSKAFPGETIPLERFDESIQKYRDMKQTEVVHGNPAETAFYAGSFDPVSEGHLEVIQRAAATFKEVVVGIGVNPAKIKSGMFNIEERKQMLEEALRARKLDNVRVVVYDDLTVDAATRNGAGFLIRGVRDLKDLNEELPLGWANFQLNPKLRTLTLFPYEHTDVSSSMVKERVKTGMPFARTVPSPVYWRLSQKRYQEIKGGVKLIGLVGGIGSGKSTVRRTIEEIGEGKIFTMDLDGVVNDVYQKADVIEQVVRLFGTDVLQDRRIDKKKLAPLVFGSPKKMAQLQDILKPHILYETDFRIEEAILKKAYKLIVVEGIGLVSSGMHRILNEVWYVDASEEKRFFRTSARDPQRSPQQVRSILKQQQPLLNQAQALATEVIQNELDDPQKMIPHIAKLVEHRMGRVDAFESEYRRRAEESQKENPEVLRAA